jgi:hypothetical protein
VAIAAGILLAGVIVRQHAAPLPSRADSDSSLLLDHASIDIGLFPRPAYASTPQPAQGAPALIGIDALSLGGRYFEYRIQYVDTNGKTTPDGEGTVRVAAAELDSTPVWRIEHRASLTIDGQRRVVGETLHVTRRELRPLTRRVHESPYLRYSEIIITQRFVGDSVYGQVSTDGGVRRPIAARLPPSFGPFLSDALAPLALTGVSITNGWRASVSALGWAVREYDVFYPATLRVIGSERYASFDCWKIRVVAGTQRRTEWVRKSDGIALRSVDEAPPGSRGRREFVLLNP